MSDSKAWRLRDWLTDALQDGPLTYHELSSRLEEKDKFFAGMMAWGMMVEGELEWKVYERTFTLKSPLLKEAEDSRTLGETEA